MRDTHTYSLLSRLELILCLYSELSGEDATDLGLHLTCPYGVLDNSTCDDCGISIQWNIIWPLKRIKFFKVLNPATVYMDLKNMLNERSQT